MKKSKPKVEITWKDVSLSSGPDGDTRIDSDLFHAIHSGVESGKITFEMKGHRRGHPPETERFLSDLLLLYACAIPADVQDRLAKAIKEQKATEPVIFKLFETNCFDCGRYCWEFDGLKFIANTKCEFDKGLPDLEFDIPIPSGRMLFANNLTVYFACKKAWKDIDVTLEDFKQTWAYAKQGLAFAFVGNEQPGAFRWPLTGELPEKFSIGHASGATGAKRIGTIDTQSWYYSICDAEEYEKRTKKKIAKETAKSNGLMFIAKCRPGLYHFRHVVHKIKRSEKKAVHCYIAWSKPLKGAADV